jgi:hypothetical protein
MTHDRDEVWRVTRKRKLKREKEEIAFSWVLCILLTVMLVSAIVAEVLR